MEKMRVENWCCSCLKEMKAATDETLVCEERRRNEEEKRPAAVYSVYVSLSLRTANV